jgi:predicted peptidase
MIRRKNKMKIYSKVIAVSLLSVMYCLLSVRSASAEKIRDEVPENPRKWVELFQNAYSFTWLRYLMYIPKDYGDTDKKYPLILYFHGAGQKGYQPNDLRIVALNAQLAGKKKDKFPFIVVSPQLPGPRGFEIPYSLDRGKWYYDDFFMEVDKLLNHLIKFYAVDESRIYCVGASMGGYGVWKMAAMYPGRFAAIAPLCGDGDPGEACKVKGLPAWVFHCEEDEIMPVKGSDKMVEALKQCGGKVEYVREKGGDHERCWSNQFDDLYRWLLTHSKGASTAPEEKKK